MSPIKMERIESSVRTVLKFVEAFNRHDVVQMMELVADECTFDIATPGPNGRLLKGRETVTLYFEDFFKKNGESRLKIEESCSLGVRCFLRWELEWMGVAKEREQLRGVDIFQVRNGAIWERLSYIKG